jgi:glycerol kinase
MVNYLLAIDQGTTSTRAMIFDTRAKDISRHQIEIKQHYPKPGWVEHDPEAIWQSTLICCKQALLNNDIKPRDIVAIGISNQRETTIIWDRATGEPIYPAIVWQDRRSAADCQRLSEQHLDPIVREKTGLVLDPYFSASKIAWILDHVQNARARALRGELAFGTIDSFLLWRLTSGKVHATDATNAARTLLFNIHTQQWDDELLAMFQIPKSLLPMVVDNCGVFGISDKAHFGYEIPITGMAGDQQAAAFGQMCFYPGMIKSTFGTGCFMLMNTGDQVLHSQHRLLSTIAYRLQGHVTYGIEGSIFMAGAVLHWLRDALHVIQHPSESEALAARLPDNGGVYFVPAFTGLGAPHWEPHARGALFGLTRNTGVDHIVRAALEAVCYQTRDLVEAMIKDGALKPTHLKVDGGMTVNHWLMQFLADIIDVRVERPVVIESSALGAALLAGLGSGIYSALDDIRRLWQIEKTFVPKMLAQERQMLYDGWLLAVAKTL